VAPSYQRHGIGKNLIEAIQKVAKGMGAYVVFVQADEGDKAINFYEAMNPSENIKTRNFDFNI
jgi:GNAT superfamily N-acetyltransferase